MSCVLPVLSAVTVGLRFWLHARQKSQLKFDDWLMLPALVSPDSLGASHWRRTDTLAVRRFCSLVCAYAPF